MNKCILVTGCSKGVGLELVKLLLQENDFSIVGISRSVTQDLVELSEKYPTSFFHIQFDLSNVDEIKDQIFNVIQSHSLVIYGFVNNAALAYDDIITNLNMGRLEEMYKINVFAPMLISKLVIRNMLLHKIKGSIVHISSISVHTAYKGLSMYASTKGALEAFSKGTAREWGERGIRSNCIVAGFMETDMSSSLSESQKDRIYKRTSLKLPTSIASVAHTISFLLSNKSESITGQNIYVDNGTI